MDLKTGHLQSLYNKMKEEGLSARTIEIANTIMHGALKKACKIGLVNRNVCDAVELPKGKYKERRVLSVEEQDRLLEELKKDRWGTAVRSFFALSLFLFFHIHTSVFGSRQGFCQWSPSPASGRPFFSQYILRDFRFFSLSYPPKS